MKILIKVVTAPQDWKCDKCGAIVKRGEKCIKIGKTKMCAVHMKEVRKGDAMKEEAKTREYLVTYRKGVIGEIEALITAGSAEEACQKFLRGECEYQVNPEALWPDLVEAELPEDAVVDEDEVG